MQHTGSRAARDRLAALADDLDRSVGPAPAAGIAVLCETVSLGAYPTAPGAYYAVRELTPGGPEVEGGAPTFAPGGTFLAANVGTGSPPVGTRLIADGCGGRFVFRY